MFERTLSYDDRISVASLSNPWNVSIHNKGTYFKIMSLHFRLFSRFVLFSEGMFSVIICVCVCIVCKCMCVSCVRAIYICMKSVPAVVPSKSAATIPTVCGICRKRAALRHLGATLAPSAETTPERCAADAKCRPRFSTATTAPP